MKKIKAILQSIAKAINAAVCTMALLLVYAIVCIYHIFVRQSRERWHLRDSDTLQDIELTKHLW